MQQNFFKQCQFVSAAVMTLNDRCYLFTCAVTGKVLSFLLPGQRTTGSTKRTSLTQPPLFLSLSMLCCSSPSLSVFNPSCCCIEWMPGRLALDEGEHCPLNHHVPLPMEQGMEEELEKEKQEDLHSHWKKTTAKCLACAEIFSSSFGFGVTSHLTKKS